MKIEWHAVCETMLASRDGEYQISRGPGEARDSFVYRAWWRPENQILATVSCVNEAGDRAAAIAECKAAAQAHADGVPVEWVE